MKYTNSYDVSIDFQPWFDTGYRFTKLYMYEEIGGALPKGEIDLECDGSDEALALITDQFVGTLTVEKEGGNIYEVEVFIDERKYFKNFLTLRFTCILDNTCRTSLISTDYPDVDSAISGCWSGTLDNRTTTDVPEGAILWQIAETNYEFLKKLCYSYRQKTIFGFSWDSSLIIKELPGIDSGGNTEPAWTISGDVGAYQLDSYTIPYNIRLYYKPYDTWEEEYSDVKPANSMVLRNYDSYSIVGTDYYTLFNNYQYNYQYMNSGLYTTFRICTPDLPSYKLGDVIHYSRAEEDNSLPFTIYMIRSNELFFAIDGSTECDKNGLNFSWTSQLVGLEWGGETLPETDPTEE